MGVDLDQRFELSELTLEGRLRNRISPHNRRKRALNIGSMTIQAGPRWVSATPYKHFKMYGREGVRQL